MHSNDVFVFPTNWVYNKYWELAGTSKDAGFRSGSDRPPLFLAHKFMFANQNWNTWLGEQHVDTHNITKHIIWGMNGVAVAPHGLILSQHGATASRNLSKCLPGSQETIFDQEITNILQNRNNIDQVLDV